MTNNEKEKGNIKCKMIQISTVSFLSLFIFYIERLITKLEDDDDECRNVYKKHLLPTIFALCVLGRKKCKKRMHIDGDKKIDHVLKLDNLDKALTVVMILSVLSEQKSKCSQIFLNRGRSIAQ